MSDAKQKPPRTVTVAITAEHIANGCHGTSGKCPGALAFNDALPGHRWSVVPENTWSLKNYGTTYRFPSELTKFVEDWDDGNPVQPGTYVCVLEGSDG